MDRIKRELTDLQRREIYDELLGESKSGTLVKGTIKSTASKYRVSTQTVSKIWKRGKETSSSNVDSKKRGRVGPKKKDYALEGRIRDVPLNKRKTLRSLAGALHIPSTSLHRRLQNGHFRKCTSALKPSLTVANQEERLQFSLRHMLFSQDGNIQFTDMFDTVHIDEKWFYLTEDQRRYYLELDEPDPHRQVKSKRFITKVMFLAAVARPRFDTFRNEWFDGKIGIWPFVKIEPAKRNSRNRCRGTPISTPVVVDRNEFRKMLIEKVLPAIRSKWPGNPDERRNTIYIQQDNAKPHISSADPEFIQHAASDGYDIRLVCQPPNSPDMNILDLGYFRAIQSAYYAESPSSVDDIILFVQQTFTNMPLQTLNKVFLTLQNCMIEILKANGGNNYKVPHMAKDRLFNNNTLPNSLKVLPEVLANAFEHLTQ